MNEDRKLIEWGSGSFAAEWQAQFLGAVPKGSLFSYFQRLGMIWKKIVAVQEGGDVFF